MKKAIAVLFTLLVLGQANASVFNVHIIKSNVRSNDPTILDITYQVDSSAESVETRALAFLDGVRSFANVIRADSFVKDAEGNDTSQNVGSGIIPGRQYNLSWKVSADWKVDLAKVSFEVLARQDALLPLKNVSIPQERGAIVVSTISPTESDILSALFWLYADADADLELKNGVLKIVDGDILVTGTTIYSRLKTVEYLYSRMGYAGITGVLRGYASTAIGKDLWFNSEVQNVYQTNSLPSEIKLKQGMYCSIDISGGASATSYPIAFLDSVPLGGWSDEYKTTKILLRRIEQGSFIMHGEGSIMYPGTDVAKPVTLTRPYYIGVFEVTQRQYQLVTGKETSYYKGDMRPVERVFCGDIRGKTSTYNWPSVTTVAASSFIGRLRSRTGIDIDLPTEAQWVYACQAGTLGTYNNGGTNVEDLVRIARCPMNLSEGAGGYASQHTIVGMYEPNAWGLYDMHGNISEWCLDYYDALTSEPETDPIGPSTGANSYRVLRGGNWYGGYVTQGWCQRGGREADMPSIINYIAGNYGGCFGFRIAMPVP